jgi:hypothetical protein
MSFASVRILGIVRDPRIYVPHLEPPITAGPPLEAYMLQP